MFYQHKGQSDSDSHSVFAFDDTSINSDYVIDDALGWNAIPC